MYADMSPKAKKILLSKVKARAGRPATGTGEWRAFRKPKVVQPKKEKKQKNERRY